MLAAGALALALAGNARADEASLYRGPAPRPGPDLLYAEPAVAPQLTNAGVWQAPPILVSGATAYRDGEFLYQDFLYDDHGADTGARDPGDPRGSGGDTFSAPNGEYTYPKASAYANNAADLVELRVRPLADATAFRITLNTMLAPERVAATIAIGTSAPPRAFPHGANATAPAAMFLTLHGAEADLLDALTLQPVAGGVPVATVDRPRRQIEVRVPHSAWDPGAGTVRLAAGVGLWDPPADRYLVPQAESTNDRPGGAGALPAPPAFFNVAFRTDEPMPDFTDPQTLSSPTWWRDRAQGQALRTGDLSSFHADVDFGRLAAGADDDDGVPRTGPLNRMLASRFTSGQGVDYARECGSSAGCEGAYIGNLQPYAVYVPQKTPANGRYGLTLLLHALSANYNEFSSARHQRQFGERGRGHIVITPEGRGPDGWYYDRAGADVFEVWADVAARYPLSPEHSSIAGYSMGGYGTFKLATQFPDLFARAQPTVGPPGLGIWAPPNPPQPGGDRSLTFRQLESLRHVPVLSWVAVQDELVPYAGTLRQAQRLDELGYRYELDSFDPATHNSLAIHDQYAPAAQFLGNATVTRNPPRVTYVRNPTMDFPGVRTAADHAYWLSGIALRDGGGDAPLGSLDARSQGFGRGDPPVGPTERGAGALSGGTFGSLSYSFQRRIWGAAPVTLRADALNVTARNVSALTVHPRRARLTCNAQLTLDTDGPVSVTWAGCGRQDVASGAGVSTFAPGCAIAPGLEPLRARVRHGRVKVQVRKAAEAPVEVSVLRHATTRRVLGRARRVKTLRVRDDGWTKWRVRGARRGIYSVRAKMALAGGGTDVRRVVVLRSRHGSVKHVRGFTRAPSCGVLRQVRLNRPAFGGATGRKLKVRIRLDRARTARVELVRHGRVVRRVRLGAAAEHRVKVRPRGLARGKYRVRVTAGGATARLTARRL